jgi:cysteinyl-tRNA synthetase
MIKIFNTITRKIEELKTVEKNHLKMYVCGPTVYDRAHIGNARSAVIYDLFFRLFKNVFEKVTYIRNITDVDDKINFSAKQRQISIRSLTKEMTEFYHQDMSALFVSPPSYEPRVTEHISEIISMIEKLLKSKNAYFNKGHILFDIKSYKDYGILSRRHIDEMISGARIEVANYKKDPLDFVLWKPADTEDDESSIFDSPFGKGRPGWHIECSAMSTKYLGETFDIHGGGADLMFPHHENEIAQSKCANIGSHYANVWIHNGFLTVASEKMSKSLNNFITVRDLLNQAVSGIVIRFFLLSTHYRKPLDYNEKAVLDAKKTIQKFYFNLINQDFSDYQEYKNNSLKNQNANSIVQKILDCLKDDLNTSKAFALLHRAADELRKNNDKNLKLEFMKALDFLGLLDVDFAKNATKSTNKISSDENYINHQIALRSKAKEEKNWKVADEIRRELLEKNIELKDEKDGKTTYRIIQSYL